jgi:hypothetical protein
LSGRVHGKPALRRGDFYVDIDHHRPLNPAPARY